MGYRYNPSPIHHLVKGKDVIIMLHNIWVLFGVINSTRILLS